MASVLALMVITVLSYTAYVVRKTNIRLVYPAQADEVSGDGEPALHHVPQAQFL
ncbi:hypothetical protein HaloA020_35090 [Halomonas sp. A020]|nr:hypothetical protein HaloA020_35090 [Halomonas sp. A020]